MATSSTSSSSSAAAATPMSMSMSTMNIVFFTSTTTPLYSTSWSPSNTGQYAGTCIFLIVLGLIFKALLALRTKYERRWQLMESRRRYVIMGGGGGDKDKEGRRNLSRETGSSVSVSSGNSDGVSVKGSGVRPWRTTQDVPRACLDVAIAGVGYLLMLAVMTLNVGYFMSVLGGTFLGSLVAGRYAEPSSH